MTECELRALIRRSEKEGFRTLYQEYKAYVYTVVWNRIGSVGTPEDAEEAVSDVFADVFLHYDGIREGSLQGYIGTVAKRTAIDWFRRLSVHQPNESLSEDVPDGSDVTAAGERAVIRQQLLAAVESLGQPDASIILQRFYYERSFTEIAWTLKMAPAAVRMRAGRALKRLKSLLGESFDLEGGAR